MGWPLVLSRQTSGVVIFFFLFFPSVLVYVEVVVMGTASQALWEDEKLMKKTASVIPLKSLAMPEQIASAGTFNQPTSAYLYFVNFFFCGCVSVVLCMLQWPFSARTMPAT